MEETTGEDCFKVVVNWTIDNFSCWNGDIHEPAMTTEESVLFSGFKYLHSRKNGIKLELYPGGLSGHDEHLTARVCNAEGSMDMKGLHVDLSFIGSNGHLFCTREIIGTRSDSFLQLPPGPKFRDVVEHTRKNEALHKDQLTLQFRFSSFRYEKAEVIESCQMHYMNSTVDAFEISVKIHFEHLPKGTNKGLCSMEYPLNDGRKETMCLVVKDSVKDPDSVEMRLGVSADTAKNKLAVRAVVSLMKCCSVLRTEETEHAFKDNREWVISDSFTKEEVAQEGNFAIFDFKFIPRNSHKFLTRQMSIPVNAFERIPPKIHRPPEAKQGEVFETDLMGLYRDRDFSIVQLECDNVTFPVLQTVLNARSPVFETMLSSDMREAATGKVGIQDMDSNTLGLFLTYLYTGVVNELQWESAFKLYYAAEKYQVPSLKMECSDFLSSNVSMSNVCDVLSISDRHRDDQLATVSHDFILKNYTEVLSSEQWECFMKSDPLLAAETLTRFAKNKRVSWSDALL